MNILHTTLMQVHFYQMNFLPKENERSSNSPRNSPVYLPLSSSCIFIKINIRETVKIKPFRKNISPAQKKAPQTSQKSYNVPLIRTTPLINFIKPLCEIFDSYVFIISMKYNPSDVVRASDTYPGDRLWNDLSRFHHNSTTMESVSTRQKDREALHPVPPDL